MATEAAEPARAPFELHGILRVTISLFFLARERGRVRLLKEGVPAKATVVSASEKDMTITVKIAGEEKTEKVSALAKGRLGAVKPGDRVSLSCKDVEGSDREIVSIRPAKEPAKK